MRVGLLVSAGGQTERGRTESPASPKGNQLRTSQQDQGQKHVSNSNSTEVNQVPDAAYSSPDILSLKPGVLQLLPAQKLGRLGGRQPRKK